MSANIRQRRDVAVRRHVNKRGVHGIRLSRALAVPVTSLVVTVVVAPATLLAASDTALGILRRATAAQGDVTYSSVGSVTQSGGPYANTSTQTVLRKAGGKERIKVQDAKGTLVWVRVCDGQTAWEYHPGSGAIFARTQPPIERLRKRDLFGLEMLGANYCVSLLGTETVAGRGAYHIRIHDPTPPAHMVREVWIDQSKHVELKARSYDPFGRLVHTVALERVNFAPSFTPDTFAFEPPAGLKVHTIPKPRFVGPVDAAARQAGFAAVLPPRVPPRFGFYRDLANVHDMRGVTVLWFQYTDGVRQFSVFERKIPPGGKEPPPAAGWARTVRVGQYHFTIVGQLSPWEFETIAAGYRALQR